LNLLKTDVLDCKLYFIALPFILLQIVCPWPTSALSEAWVTGARICNWGQSPAVGTAPSGTANSWTGSDIPHRY